MPYPYREHSSIRSLMRALRLPAVWKRITGRKLHASNYDYSIQNAVYNRLHTGSLNPAELLKTDNEQQKKLLDDVCTLANKRNTGQLAQRAQIEEVKHFISDNLQYMTADFLDYAEKIAMASGLFVFAYTIREQNDILILQSYQTKKPLTRREAARLNWARLNREQSSCDISLLTGRSSPRGQRLSPEHTAFAEYVKDKSVAIVGPSSSGADHSEEIKNDFDIIVRMNYRGRETLSESQRDFPLHIAYYNGDFTDKFSADSEEPIDYLAEMDFAVLKKFDKAKHRKVLQHTKTRVALKINGLFYRGSPNMLQVIMQDLSYFEPSRIKAFYVNLSLSATQHDEIYLKSLSRTDLEPLDQWRSWSKHSMITQYDYIRILYERGLLEADTRLTEVLELGTAEYVKQLEEQENRKTTES